jgi:hypothetical protein
MPNIKFLAKAAVLPLALPPVVTKLRGMEDNVFNRCAATLGTECANRNVSL